MSQKRFTELDSLRGIAAFTVVIGHCLMAFPIIFSLFTSRDPHSAPLFIKVLMFSPLHALWNGHSAVILFFILSGFVLSIPYYGKSAPGFGAYIIKRLCRLYIPYFVIVTISVLLINFCHNEHGIASLSDWFNGMWAFKVNLITYLKSLGMTGEFHNIDTTLWTIIIEIKISIFLPFLFLAVKRLKFIQNIFFIILVFAAFTVLSISPLSKLLPDLNIFYYTPFFLFGSLIYKHKEDIRQFAINNTVLFFIVLLIFFLYSWEWELALVLKNSNTRVLNFINDYMAAIAGCLVIMLCIMDIAIVKKIMNIRFFHFLGKISFSIYLIHPIILLLAVYAFKGVSYSYLIFLVLGLSIASSYVYYLLVENPSMKLGKWLSSTKKVITEPAIEQTGHTE